ncbi:IPT/TIG domain-containing protein [Streptomyces sp. NEAU-YJ-81]|uniref:IPT/TIG domain-containing protein n=1 Tax=Streptomyces sp. NEAU-YJ-81 TaxID=2820288 RepID=UPI001ABC16E4|nr:IPT/TIG domain-containing protein [Streptomyces sp. NEAU-YJ-81]MBO3676925.1 IPT/TIG domain-containing protein [Streptomyces sp. NEAU-YJ-81]
MPITSLTPSQGAVGTSVSINGTALGTTVSVNFGGAVVSPATVSNTLVTFVVPSTAPCSGQVSVSTNLSNGTRTNAVPFFVIARPTTTGLSETCLPAAGGALTVFGTGFAAGGTVNVGALTPVAFAAGGSNTSVTVTAPAHAPAGCFDSQGVTVTTAGGTGTAGTTLVDYYNAPSLTAATLAPATGPAGTETTISDATCLIGVTDVTFTDSAATVFAGLLFTPIDDTSLVTAVPAAAAAGAGAFTVTTCGGTSGPAAFTVT